MNNLLVFFAFPVATIIFSVALQKILRSPFLVSAVIFAVFLIVTFTVFDETFLVFAILYALLALLTALATRFICCLVKNSNNSCINENAFLNELCNDNESANNNENENNGCCCNRSYVVPYSYRRNRFVKR